MFCAAVLDAFSRRNIGWSIDSRQDSTLVVNALDMGIRSRKKWKTRLELANAIFDYIAIFHNRQRRHSSLGYRTPIEYELLSEKNSIPA